MILEEINRKESVNHRAYKFVLEICMDRIGLQDEVALKPVNKSLAQDQAKRPKGFKDIIPEKIASKMFGNKCDAEHLPIAAMFAFIKDEFKLNDEVMNKLRLTFIDYITTYSQRDLLSQYVNTQMVSNMVKRQLKARPEFKNKEDSVNKRYHQVTALFGKVITSSPAEENFSIDSPSLLAYLTEYYNTWFGMGYAEQIKSIINEKDFKINIAETGDSVDFSNYMPLEIKAVPKLKNFRKLAYNILAASTMLFSHKEEVFYDLWSREKRIIMRKRFDKLSAEMKKEFQGIKVGNSIRPTDINYKEHDNYKYRRGIYNERETLLSIFCATFDNGLQVNKYEDIYRRLIEKDSTFQEHNARQLFTHKQKMPKGKLYTNPDIFLSILLGYASVKAIVQYCMEAGIDPLSVPSDVFRDSNVYAKTSSFEDYLATYNISIKLKEEEKEVENIPNIPDNDQVIKDILYVNTPNYDLKNLSRLKFYTIKELLNNSSLNERSATVELNRSGDFRTPVFKQATQKLKNMASIGYQRYMKMLAIIKNLEKQLSDAIGDPDFEIYSGNPVTIGDTTVIVPIIWNTLNEKILEKLDNVDLSKLSYNYGKDSLGKPGHFYNAFRICNLAFNLQVRIFRMYQDICSDTTNSITMFTKLERHRDIIDLPTKLENIDSIAKLLQNAVGGIDEDDAFYPLLKLSLCYTKSASISEVNSEFIAIYNALMRSGLGSFIEKIRAIRDEIYSSLRISGAMSRSPFGKYHNAVMEKSHAIDIGVIAEESAARNADFKRYKALDENHPSHFLVVGGRAVCVLRGKLRYFVHTSGKLYCPQLGADNPSAISVINENDKFRF